jgi:hypothetical protein
VVGTLAEPLLGFAACDLNHPCEVTRTGIHFSEGTPYATPVVGLGGCFGRDGRFERTLPACPLDPGTQMQPTGGAAFSFAAQPGATLPVQVELRANGLSHYRQRTVSASGDDCRGTVGYGPVQAWTDAPAIATTIPGEPGEYLLCIQAGPGADPGAPGWQAPDQPTVAVLSVFADRASP